MKEGPPQRRTKVPPALATIAETGFGIQISPRTLDQWEVITRANRLGDNQMDAMPGFDQRQQFAKRGIDFVSGAADNLQSDSEEFTQKMTELREIVIGLPQEKRDKFAHHLRSFILISERLRVEKNPKRASTIRMAEGQMIARLYFDVLPDEILEHSNFSDYQKTVQVVSRVGNNLDTVFDLPDDYEKGIMVLEPTLRNRMQFLKDAVCEGVSVIKHIKPKAIKQIAGVTVRHYKRRKGYFE